MKYAILGPQGSGKSTQAHLLSEKTALPVVDVGQLIRDVCSHEHSENSHACVEMRKGNLVDYAFAGNLLKKRISSHDCIHGFITDGYPRALLQLDAFDPQYDFVIFVNISEKTAISRLLKRNRIDDDPETIKRRLAIYYDKTSKVLDHYKTQGILVEIDGEASPENVFMEIRRKLKI